MQQMFDWISDASECIQSASFIKMPQTKECSNQLLKPPADDKKLLFLIPLKISLKRLKLRDLKIEISQSK